MQAEERERERGAGTDLEDEEKWLTLGDEEPWICIADRNGDCAPDGFVATFRAGVETACVRTQGSEVCLRGMGRQCTGGVGSSNRAGEARIGR